MFKTTDTNRRKPTHNFFVSYGEFANTFSLCYTTGKQQAAEAEAAGWERITRKEAFRLCAAENRRRREDPAFSGYADNTILPFGYEDEDGCSDIVNDRRYRLTGYIWEVAQQ